jgi:hypothetical protein
MVEKLLPAAEGAFVLAPDTELRCGQRGTYRSPGGVDERPGVMKTAIFDKAAAVARAGNPTTAHRRSRWKVIENRRWTPIIY